MLEEKWRRLLSFSEKIKGGIVYEVDLSLVW